MAASAGERDNEISTKTILLWPHQRTCPQCKQSLHAYKTQTQRVYSVWYGNFRAKVHYLYCPQHSHSEDDDCGVLSYRSEILAKIVGRSCNYAYDVICFIGMARFVEGRQIQEICADLKHDFRIQISTTRASRLSDEFLIRLSCLHASHMRRLKRLISSKGGYYLHLDASCENKSSTVFVGLDSVTGWVLISEKIPSERAEFIVPALRKIRRSFGCPEGIMRDMAPSIANAAASVFPGVPERICHFHFLKDVGKDILNGDYQGIRSLMIAQKITTKLNALRRDLLGPLKSHHPDPMLVQKVLTGHSTWSQKHYRSMDALVLVTIIDWILDYAQDGTGLGFPFDHSYLYFYRRCETAYHGLLKLQQRVSSRQFRDVRLDTLVLSLAGACDRAYEPAETLCRKVAAFDAKASEFNKLRRVMRFYCDAKAPLSQKLGYSSDSEMRMANAQLRVYLKDAKRRIKITRQISRQTALGVIVKHLEKYWSTLEVKVKSSGRSIRGGRTNNDEESLYRAVKKKLRRSTGKKDISKEFDRLGAYMPLVQNLENPSYVQEVIGSLDNLADVFADLDPTLVQQHAEQFYEARYGVAYELRKKTSGIEFLRSMDLQI